MSMCLSRTADTFAYYMLEEFAAGFKKSPAFQTCVIWQNSGSSGDAVRIFELSAGNQCAISVVMSFMGATGMLCKVAMLSMCSEDMLAYCTGEGFADGFQMPLAFQRCVIRQNSCSSGKATWIFKRRAGKCCSSSHVIAPVSAKNTERGYAQTTRCWI